MAFKLGEAVVEFNQRGLTGVQKSASAAQRSLGGAAGAAKMLVGALTASAIAGVGQKLLGLASDAEESDSRFRAVFRDQADAVDAWADQLAGSVGRSKVAIKDGLASFQSFFVGMGFGADEAATMSKKLQEASIDFASFNNLSDDEALTRFIAGMSGSSEVFAKFGINTKAAALDAEFLAAGLDVTTANASEQDKAIARLNIIMKSMGDQGAVGDAVRTSESYANTQKRLKAEFKAVATEMGQSLLPAGKAVLNWLIEAIDTTKFFVNNFGTLWDIAIEETKLAGSNMWTSIETFFANVGTGIEWLLENWKSVFTTIADFTMAVFKNLGANVGDFFGAVKTAITGGGFDFKATGLTEGFESSIEDLPEFEEAKLKKSSEKLEALYNQLGRDMGEAHNEGFTEEGVPVPELGRGGGRGRGRGQSDARSQTLSLDQLHRQVQTLALGQGDAALQKKANAELESLNKTQEQTLAVIKSGLPILSIPLG